MTNRQHWMPYILHCLYNGHDGMARMHMGFYINQSRRGR